MMNIAPELGGIVEQLANLQLEFHNRLQEVEDAEVLTKFGERLLDKPEFAVKVFSRVLELRPGDFNAILNSAASYWLMGDDVGAHAMLQRAREIDPTDERVKSLAASIHARGVRFE